MATKKRRKKLPEFKPDAKSGSWFKALRMTQLQRLRLLKWVLYVLIIVLALVVQDVVMSRVRIFGTTTELAVCVILLITVIEGSEVGSLFVLIASTLYYFSGTAPGAYSIGLMSFLGIAASLFRQMYWNRSKNSIVLCAGIAQMGYETGLYAVGLFLGLTRWDRLMAFVLTGVINTAIMFPLYPLIYKIGLIGGTTWKE